MADQKYALLVDYTYFSGNHAAEIACKEELGAAYFDTWQWFNLSNT